VRVEYALTQMGNALGPALGELKVWARAWLR
jgi:DNA-binding HxlR family transcriptional regulator